MGRDSPFTGGIWTPFPIEDYIVGISAHKDRGIYAFTHLGLTQSVYKFENEEWISVDLPIYYNIYSMMFDGYGNLWLSVYNQLLKCVSDTECESYQGEIKPNLNAIDIDNQNNIWLGTMKNGLVRFDGANFIYYTKENTGGKLGSDDVKAVKVVGNTVWAGTYSGLASFDGENWTRWEWEGENWHAK